MKYDSKDNELSMDIFPLEHITDADILQDQKNGKRKPWKEKKVRTLKVADSLERIELEKRAERMRDCGSVLEFAKYEDGTKKLEHANFCRDRMCPMCQWRKTLKVFFQTSKVMDVTEAEHPDLVPLFLTLTLENCSASELGNTLDSIFSGWSKLMRRRNIDRSVKGWFRALEVTYNKSADSFHPHLHAILLVDKSYFKSKDYATTAEWVKLWRESLQVDYDPICDIRKVRNDGGKRKAIAEVAKYTVKDSDFLIFKDEQLTDYLVQTFSTALKNRRLFAFGKLMRKIQKQLGMDDIAEGDLIHVETDTVREDMTKVIEVYHWKMGLGNYYRTHIRSEKQGRKS